MAVPRTSAGDPARTLALLWRVDQPPRRGPERGLDLDTIVGTAIALADREGLEAVTMRRLAQELGVSTMSLYTYVPGKNELIDLMVDAAYQQMPRTDTTGKPWRQRLIAIADDNRALYLAHPWAATVSTLRPPLGPGLMAKYEHELAAFEGLGLDDVEMDAALTFVLDFVRASVLAAHDASASRSESGMTDEQWWAANAPLLERILDPDAFPLASRVGSAAGAAYGAAYSPEHAWDFGLSRVIEGLAALIDGPARVSGS